jgi:putative phosphoesterase
MRIGLISDTHGLIPDDVLAHLSDCDEILHAGDIGDLKALDQIAASKCTHWVWGNIDDHFVKAETREYDSFVLGGVKVLIIHIGGYPGRYTQKARQLITDLRPKLFVSGHSHILKIMRDKKLDLVHMNPGSCGYKGLHLKRTLIKFDIIDRSITKVQVIELADRHKV